MALTEINGIDLKELAAQRATVTQQATKMVAEKIDQIKELLRDIETIAEATGISLNLYELRSSVESLGDSHDSNWNSSSYYC